VLRCLAKEPAERFPDAEGLEHALGACSCAADWDREQAVRWWRDADAGDPIQRLGTIPTDTPGGCR
jgi:serine/threonine-protein kinase